MNKIQWVGRKEINSEQVSTKLAKCVETKHFANGGVNVINLQKKIKKILDIDDNKEVIMICNGAMAINALIGCYCKIFNKKLRFVVQGFTFPCSKQGLLMDSIILDIDENMGPDINKLEELKDEYDGILITNCFGCVVNIKIYENFCKENNKILLFDNAAAPYSIYEGKNILNYGDGCIISFHHTKPIGFGEGGAIIIDKKYKDEVEKIICFGYSPLDKYTYNIYASNYKMSEIAAIYIDQWLDNFDNIKQKYQDILNYFMKRMEEEKLDIKLFKSYGNYKSQLMSTIPVIFNRNTFVDEYHNNNIEVKKYYYPLDSNCSNCVDFFNKIICFPLHLDLTFDIIDKYINLIKLNI